MQLLAHLAFWLATHAFYYMPAALLLVMGAVFATQQLSPGLRRALVGLAIVHAVLAFLNVFVGSQVASSLVYRAGVTGRGEVVSSYGTSTQVNNHDVVGYRVLLRTAQDQVIETSFEDDDFNVYPPATSATYPGVGDTFTARYLPAYPHDFVILTNDNSPWAHQNTCAALLDSLHAARAKHEFALTNAPYKQAYRALIRRVIARQCYTDSTDLRKYYGDLQTKRIWQSGSRGPLNGYHSSPSACA